MTLCCHRAIGLPLRPPIKAFSAEREAGGDHCGAAIDTDATPAIGAIAEHSGISLAFGAQRLVRPMHIDFLLCKVVPVPSLATTPSRSESNIGMKAYV